MSNNGHEWLFPHLDPDPWIQACEDQDTSRFRHTEIQTLEDQARSWNLDPHTRGLSQILELRSAHLRTRPDPGT